MKKPHPRKKQRQKSQPSHGVKGPLELRNPHAVLAALEARPNDVQEVRIGTTKLSPAWQRVVDKANECGRRVKSLETDNAKRDDRVNQDRRNTQATAIVSPKDEVSLKEMLSSSEEQGVWLALEHVQDPHNLGAIARTAAFFGVRGLILMKDQSAALTAIAYDIAAGGVEALDHTTVTNMSRTIDAAKDADLWVVGTSEHAESSISEVSLDRRWLVIVGNEESGLRRLTKEKCDLLVGIPCAGKVTSLNVSVATGIVLSRFAG